MYIQKIEISRIRCVERINIDFPENHLSGWHVLIGDNGSGKSTILKAIAAALIEEYDTQPPFGKDWLRKREKGGEAFIHIVMEQEDGIDITSPSSNHNIYQTLVTITRNKGFESWELQERAYSTRVSGFFSMSFAPIRKFSGEQREDWFTNNPFRSRHASLFKQDMGLTEITQWLKDERLRADDAGEEESIVLKGLKKLINEGALLPNQTTFDAVRAEGLIFKDNLGNSIGLQDLSDGFQSVLGIMFELIRQLVSCYGAETVFQSIIQDNIAVINCSGAVLVDEIDAHLHPTWQTKIGQWFTHYFPKLQFIVTTHSPLICRGCAKENGDINGTIWKITSLAEGNKIELMDNDDRDALVYGDVLDAYDTNAFGVAVTRGEAGKQKQKLYRSLMYKANYGVEMTAAENRTFHQLKKIFHSDVEIDQ